MNRPPDRTEKVTMDNGEEMIREVWVLTPDESAAAADEINSADPLEGPIQAAKRGSRDAH